MIKLIKSLLRILKILVLTFLLGCVVMFIIDNRQSVTISLYPLPIEFETKLFLVIIICFLFGLFFSTLNFSKSWISAKIKQFKDSRTIKKLRHQLDQHNLKNQNHE